MCSCCLLLTLVKVSFGGSIEATMAQFRYANKPSLAFNSRPVLLLDSLNVLNRVFWAVRTTISVQRPLCASLTLGRRFVPPEASLLHYFIFCYLLLLMFVLIYKLHREPQSFTERRGAFCHQASSLILCETLLLTATIIPKWQCF